MDPLQRRRRSGPAGARRRGPDRRCPHERPVSRAGRPLRVWRSLPVGPRTMPGFPGHYARRDRSAVAGRPCPKRGVTRCVDADRDVSVGGYAGMAITPPSCRITPCCRGCDQDEVFGDCDQDTLAPTEPRMHRTDAHHTRERGQIDLLWILDVEGELDRGRCDGTYEGTPAERPRRDGRHRSSLRALAESPYDRLRGRPDWSPDGLPAGARRMRPFPRSTPTLVERR